MIRTANTIHGPMRVDDRDEFIAKQLLERGYYSMEELTLLMQHSSKQDDTLVVGAHIGAFAIPLSRYCRRLTAVEANPDTCVLLSKNVRLNYCDNVAVLWYAANDINGTMSMLCGTANSGGSKRVPKTMRDDYIYDKPTTVPVDCRRLDDAIAGPFRLIHMDIEGSEVFAMRGMPHLLAGATYFSVEFISHHLTHVAGVTVGEWLAPIREAGFDKMLLPGSVENKRPHVLLEKDDWHEMLQNIVNAGAGTENLLFWRHT